MEVNECLNCFSNCCKLEIDINKKEYNFLKKLGHGKYLKKRSSTFINDYPDYLKRRKFLDKMFGENYATITKGGHGFCQLMDIKTRLCTIYNDKPSVCVDYEINGVGCKKIKQCIN